MVDEPKIELTTGEPVPEDHSHARDRGDGQQVGYVVLSAEERAKGFVRPVRRSYRHVGVRPKHPTRELTAEEAARHERFGYVAFEPYPEAMAPQTGRYWTAAQLRSGCGVVTTMGQSLAETYAREPSFYGGTFCCGCGAHFPVGAQGEFVWEGTDERVCT
jgi:hypothetical protein